MAARKRSQDDDDDGGSVIVDEPTGLEIFDDESFADVTLYFYRVPRDGERMSVQHGYVCKQTGPIDPDQLRENLGGGVYRVLVKRAGVLAETKRIIIAGHPRAIEPPAPIAPPAPAAVEPSAEARRLDRLELILERIVTAPPAPPVDTLAQLRSAMEIVTMVRPAEASPANLVDKMLGMYERGRHDGQSGEPGTNVAEIVREAVHGIATLADIRRGAAERPAGIAAAPAPSATAANADQLAQDEFARLVVRLFNNDVDPADAADTARDVMSAAEVAGTVRVPDAMVIASVTARVPGADETTRARLESFLRGFLAELRNPTPDDAEATA